MKNFILYSAFVLGLTLSIFCSAYTADIIDPYGTHKPHWDNIIPFTITGFILATLSAVGVFLCSKQYHTE